MKTLKLIPATIISMLLFSSSCNTNNDEKTIQQNLDTEINNLRIKLETTLSKDVPSISVLIESPKGIYFSSSAGKNGHQITPDTYFRFASNTKNFTAAAILNMMQDGWLNIDDKITSNIPTSTTPYVPNNADWQIPHKSEITIKQILQHNAGIYDVSNDPVPGYNGETYVNYMLANHPNHQFTSTDLVKQLTINNLTYGAPNTVYHYSNTGFTILGEIISRVYTLKSGSPKSYNDYLYDKVYGPNSKIPLQLQFIDKATDQQLPSPYVKGMIAENGILTITDKINASAHVAEGNGIGTMMLLNRYIRTMMRGENILKTTTVNIMQNDQGLANTPQSHYAIGCSRHPVLGFGHTGATEGYLSLMMYDPKTTASVVVLIPYWDLTDGMTTLAKCTDALLEAGLIARKVSGYN